MARKGTRTEKSASTGKSNNTKNKPKKTTGSRLKEEILAIIIIAVGVFLLVAFQMNAAGQLGRVISDFFFGNFGFIAYLLPYYLVLYGILLFAKKAARVGKRSTIFFVLIYLMLAILNASRFIDPDNISYALIEIFDAGVAREGGGVIGTYIGNVLVTLVGRSGLFIFAFVVLVISILLVVNTPISQFFDAIKERRAEKKQREFEDEDFDDDVYEDVIVQEERTYRKQYEKKPSGLAGLMSKGQMKILSYMKDDSLFEKDSGATTSEPVDDLPELDNLQGNEQPASSEIDEQSSSAGENQCAEPDDSKIFDYVAPGISTHAGKNIDYGVFAGETDAVGTSVSKSTNYNPGSVETSQSSILNSKYRLPPLEFLNKGTAINKPAVDATLKAKAKKLEETLKNFNVDAKVLQVTQGPAVTRYEIQPNVGVKVNSIVRLADDIALNLEAKSIRLEAPIPGKAAVGIEVENDKVQMVTLGDILSSNEFKNSVSKITFAVGRDISGNAIAADLKTMPHMLIAGATGSGKSVCINSIIISILYKASPDEVKLVLIDPKVVELGNYNGIPHLLIPVVTEPSKAAAALSWAVSEMTDRYKKFATEGVRDLESYNNSVKSKEEFDRVLPQIVIIIDELADLMMVASSQVEESICRLAQMARAAGMHLIIATQRPSVDVITGVIKANVPSRIAFAVSSQFDSRTILDMAGAEKLVGKGDMLFNPIGIPKPVRVQCTFISDSEVHKVIEFIKAQAGETEYSSDVIHSIEKTNIGSDDDGDDLLAEAIEAVVKSKQASASALQRRFRIGYNRAARIIEMMEARGIIGPADGSRPRQVLMSEEEFYQLEDETRDIEQ